MQCRARPILRASTVVDVSRRAGAGALGVMFLCLLQPGAALAQSVALVPPTTGSLGPAVPDLEFAAFLAGLRSEALANGIAAQTFDTVATGLTPDPEVMARLEQQPEHDRTPGQYIRALVSAARVADGRRMLGEHAGVLDAVERRFGVERTMLLALWGIETGYGASHGSWGIIRSLATLAHADTRRPQFWRNELLTALKILHTGDITASRMTGSWAGAMGHTQFMPTTFARHAIDFDGDGRRDIWDSIPDALGSTANYLKASGWTSGEPWGFEVTLPAGFDYGHAAPGRTKRAPDWQAIGVGAPEGRAWPATRGELQLVLPAGAGGPAFLVTGNFRAVLRYNISLAYALSAGLLSDAIAGRAGTVARWSETERALTRGEREEMQRRLTALGHDTGGVDGILGTGSRAAIRAYQRARSLPEDSYPSEALLLRLRAELP